VAVVFRKWDVVTLLGIAGGIILILIAISLSSGISIFFHLASLLITVGASFFALLVKYRGQEIIMIAKILAKLKSKEGSQREELLYLFADLARKSRREGLLALEEDVGRIEDPFYQRGLQLAIDGLEPRQIKEILEAEIEATSARHRIGQGIFKSWGCFCLAFGMIGTLIASIQMLAELNDFQAIGPTLAAALLSTLYGAILTGLIFIPIAGKLALLSKEEMIDKRFMLDGILAVQGVLHPHLLVEKLRSYLGSRNGFRVEELKDYEDFW
jgi:chemotaxis protein MotA